MEQSGTIWKGAKKEIFRLQLLNFYADDVNITEFGQFLKDKHVKYDDVSGIKEWDKGISYKKREGVDIINLHVTDLPLADGLKFGIGFLRVHEKYGMKSLFVERKKVNDIIGEFRDFWMVDSKVVVPVVYDSNNLWVEEGKPVTDQGEVAKYITLKEILLKAATPMENFIKVNNVNLRPVSQKHRIKG